MIRYVHGAACKPFAFSNLFSSEFTGASYGFSVGVRKVREVAALVVKYHRLTMPDVKEKSWHFRQNFAQQKWFLLHRYGGKNPHDFFQKGCFQL